MRITFAPPLAPAAPAVHHAGAAARNACVAAEARARLRGRLSGVTETKRILLKAAAGAGKSFVLKNLVIDAIEHPRCLRVAVIAFQNRQLWPIAASLGAAIGQQRVCLFASRAAYDSVPGDVFAHAEVNTTTSAIPGDCVVVVATA
ncbi:MAG TPA: hypothetical protein VGD91_15835, partial [Trebonia sp.]